MTAFVEIQWTTGSLDEARRVSRYLVQERLVACAQIIPWVESIFMWDNKLDTMQETKVVFKTRKELFDKVKKVILDNCAYELPEISMVEVTEGHQEYVDWVNGNTELAMP